MEKRGKREKKEKRARDKEKKEEKRVRNIVCMIQNNAEGIIVVITMFSRYNSDHM